MDDNGFLCGPCGPCGPNPLLGPRGPRSQPMWTVVEEGHHAAPARPTTKEEVAMIVWHMHVPQSDDPRQGSNHE